MKLCLNMIVKNEAGRITRALKSALPYISCYAITDTGSTDDTAEVIKTFFMHHKVPGIINHAPFVDWSQARNAALIAARSIIPRCGWDYALLMDADMEIVVKDLKKLTETLELGGLAYDLEQRAGTLHYGNRRFISAKAQGMYRGVTHEFLDVETGGFIANDVAYFIDHADGANRPDKFIRDIRLLLGGLEKEPNNERYFYYLAQSYRDGNNLPKAIEWYRKRVAAGGWAEEQWSAQFNLALCYKDMQDEELFIREMLIAYNMRPSRAESLYELAHYFRLKPDKQNIAAMYAEMGMTIPRVNDLLFVSDHVYVSGLKEEFAITGFYNEQKRAKAFQVCSHLSLQPGPYGGSREVARHNLYFYIPKLAEMCPSFRTQNIKFEAPEDWTSLNPSVTNHNGRLHCIVRTVNYRINEWGQYLIKATDGTANDSNPINTRNYLLDLGTDPFGIPVPAPEEIHLPKGLPCEYKPVIGFEDSRLFSSNGQLWTSSTVRQIHWDGNCEQVLARLAPNDEGVMQYTDWRRMLPAHRETEKNWSPITDRDTAERLWMHRPGTTINELGHICHSNPTPYTNDVISGGSQLVKVETGGDMPPFYLALVHTAYLIPNSSCRYYYHRWALYDAATFALVCLSLPFVFEDKVIEFAAGLARHPTQPGTLVISYGYKDEAARIATINQNEVMRFLWSPKL